MSMETKGLSRLNLTSVMPSKEKTVLIYRIGQLGDTLIALPALKIIRDTLPGYRFVLLTDKHDEKSFVSSWDILGPTGWFNDVVFYQPGSSVGVWGNAVRLAKSLRRLRPEYIYNLAPDRTILQQKRDKLFFKYLIGTTNYISCHSAPKIIENLPEGRLPRVEPEWKQLMSLVDQAASVTSFRLAIPDGEKKQARAIMSSEGMMETGKLLAIGPGSKMPSKIWPQDRYAELGGLLLKQFSDIELVIVGGKEDMKLGEELCRKWGRRTHNLAGKLSIYGSAAVLEKCLMYVGNDTGAMHLGAMVGLPSVTIFSARDYPGRWEPFGEGHIVLRHETDCAGCMLETCPEQNKCLNSIAVETILTPIVDLINHSQ
jgi:heptosyltransferase-3